MPSAGKLQRTVALLQQRLRTAERARDDAAEQLCKAMQRADALAADARASQVCVIHILCIHPARTTLSQTAMPEWPRLLTHESMKAESRKSTVAHTCTPSVMRPPICASLVLLLQDLKRKVAEFESRCNLALELLGESHAGLLRHAFVALMGLL